MFGLMFDVGDGLALNIDEVCQIDFGGNRHFFKSFGDFCIRRHFCYCPDWCFRPKPEIFILSHFHNDHYNGLGSNVAKEFFRHVSKIYYPVIPEIEDKKTSLEFFASLFSMNEYYMRDLLGDLSGIPAADLISIFEKILGGRKIKYASLSQGQIIEINGKEFEVLWPPREIKDIKAIKEVKEAIKAFKGAMEANSKLKEYYKKYYKILPKYMSEEDDANKCSDNMQESSSQACDEELEITDEIEQANELLRKAANRMSLALRDKDNEILFMGDLEKEEIDAICGYLISQNLNKFNVIISPHHGTHFSEKMQQLSSKIILASCGSTLAKHMEKKSIKLKKICEHMYSTYNCGNLYFSTTYGLICSKKIYLLIIN